MLRAPRPSCFVHYSICPWYFPLGVNRETVFNLILSLTVTAQAILEDSWLEINRESHDTLHRSCEAKWNVLIFKFKLGYQYAEIIFKKSLNSKDHTMRYLLSCRWIPLLEYHVNVCPSSLEKPELIFCLQIRTFKLWCDLTEQWRLKIDYGQA